MMMSFFKQQPLTSIPLPVVYDDIPKNERYVIRNAYVEQQNEVCWYCKNNIRHEPSAEILVIVIDWTLFPDHFQDFPIHLHHDHQTGLTVGAVHMKCNAIMWQYYNK